MCIATSTVPDPQEALHTQELIPTTGILKELCFRCAQTPGRSKTVSAPLSAMSCAQRQKRDNV